MEGAGGVGEMLIESAEGACGRRGISLPKENQLMGLKERQICGDSFLAAVMR